MTNKINVPTVLLHALLSVLLISLAIWFDPRPEFVRNQQDISGQYSLLKTVLVMLIVFYTNMYLLVPKILTLKGWLPYLIVVISIFLVTLVLMRVALTGLTFNGERPPTPPVFAFLLLLVFSLSTTIKLANDRRKEEQIKKEREYESLRTELSLLRSQISPHFMFNILNTLSSLARQKSDQLETVIISVSQLMRYMLYNKTEKRISLQHELEYLDSFIKLQQLRFGDDLPIAKKITIETMEVEIEPMILIPFVENAFKHGMSTITDPQIEIDLSVKSGQLNFLVRNRFNPDIKPSSDSSGIGLENVKKRLFYLYPNRHDLKIMCEEGWFTINLTIQL